MLEVVGLGEEVRRVVVKGPTTPGPGRVEEVLGTYVADTEDVRKGDPDTVRVSKTTTVVTS